jgi:putative RecB family exonuclease
MGTLDDYRAREHWSFSALNQFLNICSLQFYFDRIAKLPKTFTPVTLSFGSAFHRVCEWISLTRKEGVMPNREDAMDLFGTLWDRQVGEDKAIRFDEDQDQDTCSKQGQDMIGCLVDGLDPEERVLAVNEAFAVPLVDAWGQVLLTPMIGEIDLVVEKDGSKSLVDWKTAAKRWSKGKAALDLQPTVFLYGYRQLHGEIPGFRFDVLVKNKTPVLERHVTERTVDHFHRMVELVKLVERSIEAEIFLPSEQGFYCGGCPHQEACRAWHKKASRVNVRMAA